MLKLAVFDLDGTLKQAPDPYTYLHERLGTLEAAEAFTAQGLSGAISYDEWLRLDTGLWTGVPRSVLVEHLRDNPYLPGARETVSALRERDVIVVIVSSGLLLHAQLVADELGIGPVIGNEVFFDGDTADPVVTGQVLTHCAYGAKRPVLESLQTQLGVLPAETLAVGDTRSDLGLFERAAVKVAVNPNHPQVAAAADIVLADGNLGPLLDLLHGVAPHLW
jgi:phosphoserine phosphatase